MHATFSTVERVLLIAALVIFGIGSRLLPHPPAATAMTAVIVASAFYLGGRASILVSLAVLVFSDIVLGTYELPVMFSVYGSFLLITLVGMQFRKFKGILSRASLLVAAPVVFFLVTNAAVWYFTPWYTKDLSGLMTSYTLALPFLRNMLVGDFVYTALIFGALSLVLSPVTSKKMMHAS